MTLIADGRVFESLPIKTEAKVVISGLYITDVKSVRGGIPPLPKKKGFFARFKKDKSGEKVIRVIIEFSIGKKNCRDR